jgi:hypothetical protein
LLLTQCERADRLDFTLREWFTATQTA